MSFSSIVENFPIVVAVIGLILLQFFLRSKRKPVRTHREIVLNLLAEARLNQAMVEAFSQQQKKFKKFMTTSWQISKTKLDFLEEPLQVALSDAFLMAEDFNQQIDAAKKYKSASYTINLNADKLKEPLAKSRQGLEEWLSKNVGQKEPPPEFPKVTDGLFGGGRR